MWGVSRRYFQARVGARAKRRCAGTPRFFSSPSFGDLAKIDPRLDEDIHS